MHVMLDLETFGNGRDAAIVSIGACLFDPETGFVADHSNSPTPNGYATTFHRRIDLTASRRPGVINASTVEWWLQQLPETQMDLISGTRKTLEDALCEFKIWANAHCPDAQSPRTKDCLWSNGPTFDEMILRDAYERNELPFFPFHFRASSCCRTIFRLAVAGGWDYKAFGKNTKKHDALSDAIFQAHSVCEQYRFLGLAEYEGKVF